MTDPLPTLPPDTQPDQDALPLVESGPAALVAFVAGVPVARVKLDRTAPDVARNARIRSVLETRYQAQVLAWGAAREVPDVAEVTA